MPRNQSLLVATMALSTGLAFAASDVEPVARATSENYVLERLTVSALSGHSSSPGFDSTVTTTELGGAAGVCPSGMVTTLGFWSILGVQPVPVFLDVEKHGGSPTDVDLSWTGHGAGFDLYRSPVPMNLESPSNLLTTTAQCALTDTTAAGSPILFYSVAPSSP